MFCDSLNKSQNLFSETFNVSHTHKRIQKQRPKQMSTNFVGTLNQGLVSLGEKLGRILSQLTPLFIILCSLLFQKGDVHLKFSGQIGHNSGTWCPIMVKFCMGSTFVSLYQVPRLLRPSDLHGGQSSKWPFWAKIAPKPKRPIWKCTNCEEITSKSWLASEI